MKNTSMPSTARDGIDVGEGRCALELDAQERLRVGGVGIGYSQHAGMVIVCDGTADAARRIERVLWNDPASGVMRHADAGYEAALACAREHGLNLPSPPYLAGA